MEKTKDKIITLAFILIVGILIMLVLDYVGDNPAKNDCIIGEDSSDCIDGGAIGGHPLWRD